MIERLERYAKVVAVFGFLFAVYQYFEAEREERVLRSLQFYESFARQVVGDRQTLTAMNSFVETQINRGRGEAAVIRDFANLQAENSVILDKVETILHGFRVCVRQRACDKHTATRLMADQASFIHANFFQLIEARRSRDRRFARSLRCFSRLRRTTGCWA